MTTKPRTTRARKPAADAEPSTAAETADSATSAEPAECVALGCAEQGPVCPTHHEAGWRYVKEPEHE